MALKAKIKYTNTDYENMRNALIRKIPAITDRWTDFNESDIGITLLELFCGVGAMLNYMLDRRVNEVYLPTMREKKHGYYFAEAVGYQFNSMVAARTILRFEIPRVLGANVIIPKYTQCKVTETSPLEVITIRDAVIPAGQLYIDVEAWQGAVTDPPLSFASPIPSPPPYILSDTNIAQGSITVRVDGKKWLEVPSLVGYSPDSEIYRVVMGPDNITTLEFGDGFEGKEPEGIVTIEYVLTSGPDGNRGSNVVNSVSDTIYDSSGNTVTISVTNTSELSGGSYPESLYHAKKQIPVEIQANSRGVTKVDIQGLVEGMPGIKQCIVLDINDYPLYSFEISYHEIRIAVVPDNEGFPGQALKDAVYSYLEDQKKYVTADIEVIDPDYVIVDIEIDIIKYRQYEDAEVLNVATDAILEFFRIAESPAEEIRLTGEADGLIFGQSIEFEQLVTEIVQTDKVSTLDFLVMTANGVSYGTGQALSDIPIGATQIALLGEITMSIAGEV